MPDLPLISVVTPCLNRKEYICEAVESVLRQGYPKFEHIIADGGSSDGTLEILRGYPHLMVLSEPDRSLYDGLNKAIRAARGDVIAHLNTDDVYPDNVFHDVGNKFVENPELDVVFGGTAIFKTVQNRREWISEQMNHDHLRFSLENSVNRMLCINGKFFRRQIYERLGLYDWTYRIAGDREFMIRTALYEPRAEFLNRVMYFYRHHADSLTFTNSPILEKINREHIRMMSHYMKNPNLTNEQFRIFQRCHTYHVLAMLKIELSRLRLRSGVGYALQGISADYRFPMKFVIAGLRKLCGLGTNFETI